MKERIKIVVVADGTNESLTECLFSGYRVFCSFMITRLNEIYVGQETV